MARSMVAWMFKALGKSERVGRLAWAAKRLMQWLRAGN